MAQNKSLNITSVTVSGDPSGSSQSGQFEGSLIRTPFTKFQVRFRKPVQDHKEAWGWQHQGTIPKGEGVITGTQREWWCGGDPGQDLGPSGDRCMQLWGPRKEGSRGRGRGLGANTQTSLSSCSPDSFPLGRPNWKLGVMAAIDTSYVSRIPGHSSEETGIRESWEGNRKEEQ